MWASSFSIETASSYYRSLWRLTNISKGFVNLSQMGLIGFVEWRLVSSLDDVGFLFARMFNYLDRPRLRRGTGGHRP